MIHTDILTSHSVNLPQSFQNKLTGCYYTHQVIALNLFKRLINEQGFLTKDKICIYDPFAGDGRLITWLIELCVSRGIYKKWEIYLFDINSEGMEHAEKNLRKIQQSGVNLNINIEVGDAFKIGILHEKKADIVVTNPPWALLKPDKRNISKIREDVRDAYINSMKEYDLFLSKEYPFSQPRKKFAGWGTNLSRVGIELSHSLLKDEGYCCIVVPASFFADNQSGLLRKKLISESDLIELSYYPAEAKMFKGADVSSATLIYRKEKAKLNQTKLIIYNEQVEVSSSGNLSLELDKHDDYMIPITLGTDTIEVLYKIKKSLPTWGELESINNEIWSGRELDETGSKNWLVKEVNPYRFVKGRMVTRFELSDEELLYVYKSEYIPPKSSHFKRIAWRDVSRPSQKRRMIASIIPEGVVTGNSLGVIYYRDNDEGSLIVLLAIMNSLVFEFQLRFYLATGHVSLSALRKVHIPDQKFLADLDDLMQVCVERLNGNCLVEPKLEAMIAHQVYHLNEKEIKLVLDSFTKLTREEKDKILVEFNRLQVNT